MSHHQHGSQGEEHLRRDSDEQLKTTAEHWREGHEGTEAEDSADEIAHGAERAARQPDYGREGS